LKLFVEWLMPINSYKLRDRLAQDFDRHVAPRNPLEVLVVDDSATVRQVLTAVLPEKHGFRVIVAADPLIAMQKMKKSLPDVILLDLEMPHMDGMTFLRKLMAENPIPVVVCSALTGPTTDAAIRALECGAVDIITKPAIGVRGFLEESAMLLEDTVRAAAAARLRKSSRRTASAPIESPRAASNNRRVTFSSSRILPGHGSACRTARASALTAGASPPNSAAYFPRKCCTSDGMSSRRSRNGGR